MDFVYVVAITVPLACAVGYLIVMTIRKDRDRAAAVLLRLKQQLAVPPEARDADWRTSLLATHGEARSLEQWTPFEYPQDLRTRVQEALVELFADKDLVAEEIEGIEASADVGLSAATDLRLDELLRSFSRPKPLQVQDSYLASLRGNSCYPVVRQVHGIVVILAVIGNVLFLFAGLSAASQASYQTRGDAYGLAWGIAAAMAFGIFIERALFIAILDAVDVMVDNARYQRQRDQQPPKAG